MPPTGMLLNSDLHPSILGAAVEGGEEGAARHSCKVTWQSASQNFMFLTGSEPNVEADSLQLFPSTLFLCFSSEAYICP